MARAYYNRGGIYLRMGEYQRGIQDLDEAIRLDPSARGSAYDSLGQHQRGIRDLDETIRLAPQLTVAHVNRGSAYSSLGQLEQAIRDLNEAIRLEPQLAEACGCGKPVSLLAVTLQRVTKLGNLIRILDKEGMFWAWSGRTAVRPDGITRDIHAAFKQTWYKSTNGPTRPVSSLRKREVQF